LPAAGAYLIVTLIGCHFLPFRMNFISQPAANQTVPYSQASVAQREQLLAYLRRRLPFHFPTLSPAAWLRALFEFQPTLVLAGTDSVTLAPTELQQLVQHLVSSPELPLLDPPIYILTTCELAQRFLHSSELAAAVLPELPPGTAGPRLLALLTYLCQPFPLAEQVVQAWRWDLASAPPLPPNLPGGGPTPGSPTAQDYLARLRRPSPP
jgi:hypothetical protein